MHKILASQVDCNDHGQSLPINNYSHYRLTISLYVESHQLIGNTLTRLCRSMGLSPELSSLLVPISGPIPINIQYFHTV